MTSAAARSGITFALLLPLLLAAQPVATDSYLPALPAITRDLGAASAREPTVITSHAATQSTCGTRVRRASCAACPAWRWKRSRRAAIG